MSWWMTLVACRPGVDRVDLRPSPTAAAAVVARFEAPEDAATELRVIEDDGATYAVETTRRGTRREATLVGLPAGEPFQVVAMVDGVEGEPTTGQAPSPSAGMPTFEVAFDDVPFEGFALVALTDPVRSMVGVVDGAGRWRWWWEAAPDRTFASPRPTADGFLWASQDRARGDVAQLAHVRSLDGQVSRDIALTGAHHMVAELDDDSFAWLAWDTREVPWVDGVPDRVTADRVMVGRGDGDEHERLAWFDDLGPAEIPCSHGLVPIHRGGEPTYEWTHANSIAWEPTRDELVVNARLTDTILGLDRQTGAVAWQLGGAAPTLSFADPADAFSHAHLSDVRPDQLLVFDNGVHREERLSRVIAYTLDRERSTVVVDDVLDLGVYVDFLGDARWRDDGGYLVATSSGSLTTFDRAHSATWRLRLDRDAVLGRVHELDHFP